jgi:hypothetical protein
MERRICSTLQMLRQDDLLRCYFLAVRRHRKRQATGTPTERRPKPGKPAAQETLDRRKGAGRLGYTLLSPGMRITRLREKAALA